MIEELSSSAALVNVTELQKRRRWRSQDRCRYRVAAIGTVCTIAGSSENRIPARRTWHELGCIIGWRIRRGRDVVIDCDRNRHRRPCYSGS